MATTMMRDGARSEQLLRSAAVLTGKAWVGAFLILLVYVCLNFLLERLFGDYWIYFAIFMALSFMLNAVFVWLLLRQIGIPLAGPPATMLIQGTAASFLITIGILMGFILLILPGIYLMIRWFMTVPIVMVEGGGISSAARHSAEYAKGRFWPLCAALILIYLPYVIVFGALMVAGIDEHPLVEDFVLLPIEGLMFVLSCSLSVVAFVEFRDAGRLKQVFA